MYHFSRFFLLMCLLFGVSSYAKAQEQPFQEGSFKEILEKGKTYPLIVNFWSYDCPPCLVEMSEFDHFVQQHDDVRLVLVSTDPWDQMKRIKRTLSKYGPARFDSWVFAHSFTEKIRFDIDRKWRGQLPRTYLVARDGSITTHTGTVDSETLVKWYEGQE